MNSYVFVFAVILATCYAGHHHVVDYHAYPKYEFKYGVEDHHTHDSKQRSEHRDGELVKQQYSWGEKDRIVKVSKVDDHAVPVEHVEHHHVAHVVSHHHDDHHDDHHDNHHFGGN